MKREAASGIIKLEHDCICYQVSSGGWRLPVSEIKIIGEHTDDQGPLVDDYFLVFITNSDLYEVSFYAEGFQGFLQRLSDRLGTKLSCELGNSTDYRSRVMWPFEMEGMPVFEYFKTPKPNGIWAKLRYWFFSTTSWKLSNAVRQRLNLDSTASGSR
jgi:hypothetical protein